MAVFRLHRKEWEKGLALPPAPTDPKKRVSAKRKRKDTDDEDESPKAETFPGGGRKGVSSGLSVVVRGSKGTKGSQAQKKGEWWKDLPQGGGKKGSITMK